MSIKSFLSDLLSKLWGDAEPLLEEVGTFVEKSLTAFFHNMAAMGIPDVKAFLNEMELIVVGIAENPANAALHGDDLKAQAVEAGLVLLKNLGADVVHAATSSVINTAIEMSHQPSVAVRLGTEPAV